MTWFEEMKPFFVFARACGMAPYSFANGEICSSRGWRIYTFICIVVHICIGITCGHLVYTGLIMAANQQQISLPKYFVYVLTRIMSCIIDALVYTSSFDQLRTVIDLIDDYDRAFRVNFAKRSGTVSAWLMLTVPGIYYGSNVLLTKTYPSTIYYIYYLFQLALVVSTTSTILNFTAMVNTIHRRFQHLCTVIIAERPTIVYVPGGNWRRPVRLCDIGRLHGTLISAATLVNSMRNIVLLLWLGKIIIYYTVTLPYLVVDFTAVYTTSGSGFIIMGAVSLYLCFCCHRTSKAANKIGYMALSTRSCVLRNRLRYERDENFFVGQHFILHPFCFSAGYGVIIIDLHLVKTIIGTVTTLVVNIA